VRALSLVLLLVAAPAAAQMDASAPLAPLPAVVREDPSVPGFLAPNDARAEDYRVEWLGAPIPDVELDIEKGSLQWARVDGVLRLPRGRLAVVAKNVTGGTVTSAGFVQVLSDGAAKMLIPLVSGEGNPIEIGVMRDGAPLRGRVIVKYAPRKAAGDRIYVDTTCSGFSVRAEEEKAGRSEAEGPGNPIDEWIYVGCRNTTALSTEHRTNSLEIVLFWDNVGRTITVNGVPTDSGGDSIWNLRASSSPGFLELAAGDHKVTLRYSLANFPRKAFLGMGIGPYFDTFVGTGNDTRETLEPVITLYGSYAISPWSRLVLFNATPMRADTYSDTGFYLQKRTSEALDRRVVANVFLGGHFIAFTAEDPFDPQKKKQIFYRTSAPQGVEFTVRDAPRPGYNVVVGGLTNPGIGGTAYYNLWLRWGNPAIFVEINYIGWQELIPNPEDDEDTREVELRSIGVSVGFPIFKFL